jgi:hypothetical protein
MMEVVRGRSDILIISCISSQRAFRFRYNVLEIILNDINMLGSSVVGDPIGQQHLTVDQTPILQPANFRFSK